MILSILAQDSRQPYKGWRLLKLFGTPQPWARSRVRNDGRIIDAGGGVSLIQIKPREFFSTSFRSWPMETTSRQIISRAPFFQAVTGQSLAQLLDMALLRQYPRGTLIFRQGQTCPGVFVVGYGRVRIYKTAPNGKEHVLHLVGPGGNFAEVACIGGFECPAFAEALEDTTCVLLPAERFNQALREDHQLCLQLLTGMSRWVRHLLGLVEDMTLRDALSRVARHLLAGADQGESTVQLPSLKKHLASHLNLTSETLSRALRRLSQMRLIQSNENGIVLLDRQALQTLADGMVPLV